MGGARVHVSPRGHGAAKLRHDRGPDILAGAPWAYPPRARPGRDDGIVPQWVGRWHNPSYYDVITPCALVTCYIPCRVSLRPLCGSLNLSYRLGNVLAYGLGGIHDHSLLWYRARVRSIFQNVSEQWDHHIKDRVYPRCTE